jgi:hypothetical protein
MSSTNNSSIWPVVFIILGIAVAIQMITGGNNTTTSTPSAPRSSSYPTDTSSLEYEYARGRFKQEGYSDADADTAARAVIKFNDAQKARK